MESHLLVDLDLPALRRRARRELFHEQGTKDPGRRNEALKTRVYILAQVKEQMAAAQGATA